MLKKELRYGAKKLYRELKNKRKRTKSGDSDFRHIDLSGGLTYSTKDDVKDRFIKVLEGNKGFEFSVLDEIKMGEEWSENEMNDFVDLWNKNSG